MLFCWVLDSILPLSPGFKKGQLSKIHTYLVTCRQGISGALCELLHAVWQASVHQSWDGELLGLGRSPWMDQAPGHWGSATVAGVGVYLQMRGLQVYGILCEAPRPAGTEDSHCPYCQSAALGLRKVENETANSTPSVPQRLRSLCSRVWGSLSPEGTLGFTRCSFGSALLNQRSVHTLKHKDLCFLPSF